MTSQELKELRAATGLSQDKFARLLGVSTNTVARWESGSRRISELTAAGIRAKVEKGE